MNIYKFWGLIVATIAASLVMNIHIIKEPEAKIQPVFYAENNSYGITDELINCCNATSALYERYKKSEAYMWEEVDGIYTQNNDIISQIYKLPEKDKVFKYSCLCAAYQNSVILEYLDKEIFDSHETHSIRIEEAYEKRKVSLEYLKKQYSYHKKTA